MLCEKWLNQCEVTGYKGCFGIAEECLTPNEAYQIMSAKLKEVANVGEKNVNDRFGRG